MDMTAESIISEYEDLWRQASLENAKQMNVDDGAPGPWRSCAWLAAENFGRADLRHQANIARADWQCPSCGVRYQSGALANALAHTNNQHLWKWDMFANKFRDAWAEGLRLAAER